MNSKFIKIFNQEKSRGFTLMEVIVALFFISTGIIGSYLLINSTIFATTQAVDKFTAVYLAQEGIELVRNIRDTNWLEPPANPPDPDQWHEDLNNCSGSCDELVNGCMIDYASSQFQDPASPFPAYDGTPLKIESSSNLYGYAAGTNSKFKRKITISNISFESMQICVWVGWEEKGTPNSFTLREDLYNWR